MYPNTTNLHHLPRLTQQHNLIEIWRRVAVGTLYNRIMQVTHVRCMASHYNVIHLLTSYSLVTGLMTHIA